MTEQEKMYFIVFPQTFTSEFSTGVALKMPFGPGEFSHSKFLLCLVRYAGVFSSVPTPGMFLKAVLGEDL